LFVEEGRGIYNPLSDTYSLTHRHTHTHMHVQHATCIRHIKLLKETQDKREHDERQKSLVWFPIWKMDKNSPREKYQL